MPEHQNIEYKQSWHDDHLKTICAFANSKGGILYIGKDNNSKTIGLSDVKKLLEDLPNKIRNYLGITSEINLKKDRGKYYVEIIIPQYSVAISLRGRYYIRSGSTTSELTGNSLNDFLLKKSGKTWDDVIEERATLDDIDEKSVSYFLTSAQKSGRVPDLSDLNTKELFEKLRLIENDRLKRASIILFGKDPGKFYPNISVKIGCFGKTDDDLQFQEIEEGNIFHLLKAVPQQLNRKFFTHKIDFEGLLRIEKGEYPVAALREMLLNALVHKNYSGAPIQIRVYDDKLSFWNEGTLPEGLSFEALRRPHPSRPRNPIIADVCFKGGYIDAWGRGTLKIINSCKDAELPEPEMKESDGGFLITIFKDELTEDKLKLLKLNQRQIKAVLYVKEYGNINNKVYRELNMVSERTATRDLTQLVSLNLLEQIGTTGKGTNYILRRHKDANDATKKT